MTKRIATILLHLNDTPLAIALLLFLRILFHKYTLQLSSLIDISELQNEPQPVLTHDEPETFDSQDCSIILNLV